MKRNLLASAQANFLAGLAVVLPAVISLAVLSWLFGVIARFTDTLLVLVPLRFTHPEHGTAPYWYWSLLAFVIAVTLIGGVGLLARHYFGRKIIQWVDSLFLRVPLLNKIYGSMKQVNEAFMTSNKTTFRTVAMVEFPRPGSYTVGFVTCEQQESMRARAGEKLVAVFVPTTPNPTSGFLLLVPEASLVKLDMSVADGIKYIISLGTITPDSVGNAQPRLRP